MCRANVLQVPSVVPGSMWSQIKSKGTSGVISYVITELAFWTLFPLLLYALPPGEEAAAAATPDNVSLLRCGVQDSCCSLVMLMCVVMRCGR